MGGDVLFQDRKHCWYLLGSGLGRLVEGALVCRGFHRNWPPHQPERGHEGANEDKRSRDRGRLVSYIFKTPAGSMVKSRPFHGSFGAWI